MIRAGQPNFFGMGIQKQSISQSGNKGAFLVEFDAGYFLTQPG